MPKPTPLRIVRDSDDERLSPESHVVIDTNAVTYREKLLQHGYSFRRNLRSDGIELTTDPSDRWSWRALDDYWDSQVSELFTEQYVRVTQSGKHRPAKWGREDRWAAYMSASADTPVDPFAAWLETLPVWDGVERLPTMLGECFDIHSENSEELVRWASQASTLAAVKRTVDPGHKCDYVIVLVGPQGSGKSSFWRALLPPKGQADWFTDHLDLSDQTGRKIEATTGAVLVEIAELAGTNRAEIEKLKAFITRTTDRHRMAYHREVSVLQRRFVMVGTTNDRSCLPDDPTGNRRFIPVSVNGGDRAAILRWVGRNRKMLWAEACAKIESGVSLYPETIDLLEQAAEAAERHRDADDQAENLLPDLLESCAFKNRTTTHTGSWMVKTSDIATEAFKTHDVSRSTRMWAKQLRSRGWENLGPTKIKQKGQAITTQRVFLAPDGWRPCE